MDEKKAFTLIELAIVVVIVALVIGGMVIGRSMIHDAELRVVAKDAEAYRAVIHQFKEKYRSLPGDMPNAESYWGTVAGNCHGSLDAPPGTATCNGDGDNLIEDSDDAGNLNAEQFRAWQHLANAGMIQGVYNGHGYANAPGGNVLPSFNVPKAAVNDGGFGIMHMNTVSVPTDTVLFPGKYDVTILLLGAAGGRVSAPPKSVLTPGSAYDVDRKADDGYPAYGSILTFEDNNFGSVYPDCTTTTDPATAQYDLAAADIRCALIFKVD